MHYPFAYVTMIPLWKCSSIKMIVKNIVLLGAILSVAAYQTMHLATANKDNSISAESLASAETKKYEEALVLAKRMPVLGFNNIRANISLLSFLQYFGDDEMREKNGYSLSSKFFETIISNDPYYTKFYVFLTNSVSLNAAQPKRSAELMSQGLASLEKNRLDDSFYVWRYKGVDELLFLDNAKSAQHSFMKASEWAYESNLAGSNLVASISQQTADFLAQNPNSKAAQIGAWSSVLATAVDDETRKRAIESIQALGGEIILQENGEIEIEYAQTEQEVDS